MDESQFVAALGHLWTDEMSTEGERRLLEAV